MDDEVDNNLLKDEPPDQLEDGPADDIADEQNASEAENEALTDDSEPRGHFYFNPDMMQRWRRSSSPSVGRALDVCDADYDADAPLTLQIVCAFVNTHEQGHHYCCDVEEFSRDFGAVVRRSRSYGIRFPYTAFMVFCEDLLPSLPGNFRRTAPAVLEQNLANFLPLCAMREVEGVRVIHRGRRIAREVRKEVRALARPEHWSMPSALRDVERQEEADRLGTSLTAALDEAIADLFELKILDEDLRRELGRQVAYATQRQGFLWNRDVEGINDNVPAYSRDVKVDLIAQLFQTQRAGWPRYHDDPASDYLTNRQRARDLCRWWRLTNKCHASLLRAADAVDAARAAHARSKPRLAELPYEVLTECLLPFLDTAQLATLQSTSRTLSSGAFGKAIGSRLPFWRLRMIPGTLVESSHSEPLPFTRYGMYRRVRRDAMLDAQHEPGYFPHHREHIAGFAGDRAQNFVDCRKSVTLMVELCTMHKRPKPLVPYLKVREYDVAVATALEAQDAGGPPHEDDFRALYGALKHRRYLAVPEGAVEATRAKAEECMAEAQRAEFSHALLVGELVVAGEQADEALADPNVDRETYDGLRRDRDVIHEALASATQNIIAAYERSDWPCGEWPADHYVNRGPNPESDPLRGGPATQARIHWLRAEFGLVYGDLKTSDQSMITFKQFRAEPLDPDYERRRVNAAEHFAEPYSCHVELLDASDGRVLNADGREQTPRLASTPGVLEQMCGYSCDDFRHYKVAPGMRMSYDDPNNFAATLPARSKVLIRALSGSGLGIANQYGPTRPMRAWKLRVKVTATKHSGRKVSGCIETQRFVTVADASVLHNARKRAREAEEAQRAMHDEAAREAADAAHEPDAKVRRLLEAASEALG